MKKHKPTSKAYFLKMYSHSIRNFIFLLMAGAVFQACDSETTYEADPVRPVSYYQCEMSSVKGKATFTGVTRSSQEAAVAFKVSGVVDKVNVKNGQKVKKGQLIASLDPEDYALQVEQAKVQVKQAETNLNVARSTYQRIERLYEGNSVSLSEFEQAKGSYEASEAQLAAANQQVQAAQNQLGYTRLKAPFSGIISNLNVEEGELAGAGNPIAILDTDGKPQVEVGLADRYISRIKQGQAVNIRLSAYPEKSFKGEVTEVSYSQSQSTTYPVRARFIKPNQDIRPGLSAEVEFEFGKGKSAASMIIPAKAIGEDAQGQRFVYLLVGAGDTLTVEKRIVKLGELGPEGFALLEGLSSGDKIATAGLSSLLEGMKVLLLD
ncbi:MAG: efflux RND transporter periplasmic adaptor subunit [Bacteroidia bacterium]|nr:efflux RND transporter periplasmic adaptor subunit [Bacteroidia bacterium]